LRELLPEVEFTAIDILEPFYKSPRFFRSIGFRWKVGPLINRVNDFVSERISDKQYDLIWVDKAVFLTESTTASLCSRTRHLVHFTPDPAFKYHQSSHFNRSLKYYDKVVTTKSYEIEDYSSYIDRQRLLLVTQGFDPTQHFPRKMFDSRISGACFIGHHVKSRQEIIDAVLQNEITVFVAGRGWKKFARSHSGNQRLQYGGEGVYGNEYAERLSDYKVGLGLLSKWVPEKHTTRTFEIPACGAILVTERNNETNEFFNKDEALFYGSTEELVKRLRLLLDNPAEAGEIAQKGLQRVQAGGFDYRSIVSKILTFVDEQ